MIWTTAIYLYPETVPDIWNNCKWCLQQMYVAGWEYMNSTRVYKWAWELSLVSSGVTELF